MQRSKNCPTSHMTVNREYFRKRYVKMEFTIIAFSIFILRIVHSRMRMNRRRLSTASNKYKFNAKNAQLIMQDVRFGHSFNSIVSIYRFYFWFEWLMDQKDCVKHKTFMTLWLHDGFRSTCDGHKSSRYGDDRRQQWTHEIETFDILHFIWHLNLLIDGLLHTQNI